MYIMNHQHFRYILRIVSKKKKEEKMIENRKIERSERPKNMK